MIMKNNRIIKKYIKKKWCFSDDFNFDSLNETICFFIQNDMWWHGGFDTLCLPKEKAKFYDLVDQTLTIILEYADINEEKFACIGPFNQQENYEFWTNKEEFDSFNELKEHIKNNEYLLIDIESNKELLGLVIETNYRYLTQISILFPKSDVLIYPNHSTELLVYSVDSQKALEDMDVIIKKTGWRIKKTGVS